MIDDEDYEEVHLHSRELGRCRVVFDANTVSIVPSHGQEPRLEFGQGDNGMSDVCLFDDWGKKVLTFSVPRETWKQFVGALK